MGAGEEGNELTVAFALLAGNKWHGMGGGGEPSLTGVWGGGKVSLFVKCCREKAGEDRAPNGPSASRGPCWLQGYLSLHPADLHPAVTLLVALSRW